VIAEKKPRIAMCKDKVMTCLAVTADSADAKVANTVATVLAEPAVEALAAEAGEAGLATGAEEAALRVRRWCTFLVFTRSGIRAARRDRRRCRAETKAD
jgi:hypothetical protein